MLQSMANAMTMTPGGVVHANVGQKHLNRNILSNFKTDRSKTCTLLFGDASHFSY